MRDRYLFAGLPLPAGMAATKTVDWKALDATAPAATQKRKARAPAAKRAPARKKATAAKRAPAKQAPAGRRKAAAAGQKRTRR